MGKKNAAHSNNGGTPLVVDISVYAQAELKRLAGEAADREELPLNQWVVNLIAQKLERPELAKIPSKKRGRPRKELQPA